MFSNTDAQFETDINNLLYELMHSDSQEKKLAVIQALNQKVKPLVKDKKYSQLLKIYQRVDQFFPNNGSIKKTLSQLVDLVVNEKTDTFEHNFIDAALKKAQLLYKEKDYQNVIKLCEAVLKYDAYQATALNLEKKARVNFVKEALKTNGQKVKFLSLNDQLAFYEKLYYVYPESYIVHKKITACQKTLKDEEIKTQKNYILNSLNRVKTFLKDKDYKNAIQAGQEILSIDDHNQSAKNLIKKAQMADDKIIEEELIRSLKENQKNLKNIYKTNKIRFIKI